MDPVELSFKERTVLFHRLLNHLDASNRMVVEVADDRWQVAVTKFREGLKDSGLTRAVGQYLAGLFLSKDDAVTDFVQDVTIMGKRQDVMVSWASSAAALKEELLVIQSCLNTAGLLDDRQPLDFDLGADVSVLKKTLGAGVHYDNTTRQVELTGDADPAKLLTGILSMHLSGRLGFSLRKNHLHNDPRLPMMAGIIALEAGAGGIDLTCQNLSQLMAVLTSAPSRDEYIQLVTDELEPVERYLRDVFAALRQEVEHLSKIRGTVMARNPGLAMDGIIGCLFDDRNFAGAFAGLKLLRNIFELQNLHDPRAQSTWTLLSAAVYLGAQVTAIKSLLPDPKVDYSMTHVFRP